MKNKNPSVGLTKNHVTNESNKNIIEANQFDKIVQSNINLKTNYNEYPLMANELNKKSKSIIDFVNSSDVVNTNVTVDVVDKLSFNHVDRTTMNEIKFNKEIELIEENKMLTKSYDEESLVVLEIEKDKLFMTDDNKSETKLYNKKDSIVEMKINECNDLTEELKNKLFEKDKYIESLEKKFKDDIDKMTISHKALLAQVDATREELERRDEKVLLTYYFYNLFIFIE